MTQISHGNSIYWNHLIFPELFGGCKGEPPMKNQGYYQGMNQDIPLRDYLGMYQGIHREMYQGLYQKLYRELLQEIEQFHPYIEESRYQLYQRESPIDIKEDSQFKEGELFDPLLLKLTEELLNCYNSMAEMVGYFDDSEDEYIFYINS